MRSNITPDSHTTHGGRTLTVFAICTLYVCAFWGQAATWLPTPLNEWHSISYRLIYPWWHRIAPSAFTVSEQIALYQIIEALILALLVPIYFLRHHDYSLRHMWILRVPDRQGWWRAVAGVVLTVPVGFWLSSVVPDPWGSPLNEGLGFLLIVPEHFLIFGVVGALLLPAQRLAWPDNCPPQCGHTAFAIVATTGLFGLIHVGASLQELLASFYLGLVFAFLTIRSASLWPAIIAHWMLNLIPMTWNTL